MTKIIICGAGFAGLNTALKLGKKFRRDKTVEITLIDQRDYHLFTPSLYEVAAADEEFTSVSKLEQSIVLPLRRLLAGTGINFIQGQISGIVRQRRVITIGHRELGYDYLILALGSKTEYFGVEGARQFSMPLKTLTDAFRIRNALGFTVESHRHDGIKPYIRFVVAGGGFSGVELAGEMAGLADILAWKNNYPREKIEILIVEAANSLVPGFSERASRDIYVRLAELGVRIKLVSPIFKVDQHFVTLLSGEKILYDALIWTTGVRAQDCGLQQVCASNKRGQLETDEYLRVKGETHIFAVGDSASIRDLSGAAVPATAQAAEAEAGYLAQSFPFWLQNKKPAQGFLLGKHPFIVSVGGKWAIYKSDKFYFTGRAAYWLRLAANWLYFAPLLGRLKAARYVWSEAELYSRND